MARSRILLERGIMEWKLRVEEGKRAKMKMAGMLLDGEGQCIIMGLRGLKETDPSRATRTWP